MGEQHDPKHGTNPNNPAQPGQPVPQPSQGGQGQGSKPVPVQK